MDNPFLTLVKHWSDDPCGWSLIPPLPIIITICTGHRHIKVLGLSQVTGSGHSCILHSDLHKLAIFKVGQQNMGMSECYDK